ncbi:hypothetical protein WJX77_004081 [Trebouxia sp. C0004]
MQAPLPWSEQNHAKAAHSAWAQGNTVNDQASGNQVTAHSDLGLWSFFGQVLEASLTFTTLVCNSGLAYISPQAKQALATLLYAVLHQLAYSTPAQKPQMPY